MMLPIEKGLNAVLGQAGSAPVMFERLTLSESWCEAESREYELVWNGSALACSRYYGCWNDDKEREKCLEKRVTLPKADYERLCADMGKWGVRGWLGRSYSHPGVLDGEGFHLTLVENGRKDWSGGSNAFPENYSLLIGALRGIFA